MSGSRLRLLIPLLGTLIHASCADARDPAAPVSGPMEPLLAVDSTAASVVYLPPVRIEREAGLAQTVAIALDTLPWSRFMEPFQVHVVVEGDSVLGNVRVDGAFVVRLQNLTPGDTSVRRIEVDSASQIEVRLAGPVPGAVTVWVTGMLQPGPVISLTTPGRARMLLSDDLDTALVSVSGSACDANFPITGLIVNGVPEEVDGTQLCEPFTLRQPSARGTSSITVIARNARGRETSRVQSFLRSGAYHPASVDPAPWIDRAMSLLLTQPALDDHNRTGDPADLGSMLHHVLQQQVLTDYVPDTIADAEPVQPLCTLTRITRVGYRIEHGAVTSQPRTVVVTAITGGIASTTRLDEVVMPVTVYEIRKRSCESPVVRFHSGTATIEYVDATTISDVVLSGGEARTHIRPGSVTTGVGAVTISLSFARSLLSAQQQENARASVVEGFRNSMRAGVRDRITAALLPVTARFFGGIEPTALPAELGSMLDFALVQAQMTTSGMRYFWDVSLAPSAQRPGALPQRGPIAFRPVIEPVAASRPIASAFADDLVNAVFWSAWQGGEFDSADLMGHPAATRIPGLRIGVRSLLPPVLAPGSSGGKIRVGWGDLRLALRIDPSIFGNATRGTPRVAATAYATVYIEAAMAIDAATSTVVLTDPTVTVLVEVPSITSVLIDEARLRSAIESVLVAVAPELIGPVFTGLPLPASPLVLPGLPDPSIWHIAPQSVARDIAATTVRGPAVVD